MSGAFVYFSFGINGVHPEQKKPAEVRYPDECWYCGICADRCPVDAVKVIFPPEMVNCTTPPEVYMGLGPGEA